MTKKIFLFSLTFSMILVWQSCFGQATSAGKTDIKRNVYLQKVIQNEIKVKHFQPLPIDDAFSEKIFKEYIKMLDYYKRFLTQADMDALSKYKYSIDDEYLESRFEFFDLSVDIIKDRTALAERYCFDILTKPFDFSKKEMIQMDPDSLSWAKDTLELKNRWKEMLKYDVLNRVYTKKEAQDKAVEKSDTVTIKTMVELEQEARTAVEKRYKDWFSYLLQSENDDYFSNYLNAILAVYDPHTGYFPPKEKEDFDIRFSGQLQGIGATLTQKDGYITVNDIVAGSPSWKQGELEVNDKILKVAQGSEEPVDIVDMRLDKAIRFIRGPKGTEVRLTIQKIDGSQKVISIIRDVVVIEETYAKSMVLTDKETNERVGYIYLPSFYANFQDPRGRRCAEDMKKEVTRLKTEKVSGIVIDLRNNTGGSLSDCVDIAGLFIDKGPVVQVKTGKGAPQVLPDLKAGTLWDGPLVIMVNNYSASASEIFAAAMQDYQRAIILGSTTYGKGTVQRFDDLDADVPGQNDIKPLGFIKLTIQKFYRINGGSTQLKGVTPDILIPDAYTYIETGEREMDNALPWTEIDPSKYTLWNDGQCKWDPVIKKSQQRIQKNEFFTKMNENAKRLKMRRDQTIYPLNFNDYTAFIKKQNDESDKYKDLGKDTLQMEAIILSGEETLAENDTTQIERNKRWYGKIVTDNTLYEAVKVIQDIEKVKCFATKKED